MLRAKDLIRILFLLFQVIAQIASAPSLEACQLSSPSSQPKASAEEPLLKAVDSVPGPVVVLRRRSELPKTHAKRSLEKCGICSSSLAENGPTRRLPDCRHEYHSVCFQQFLLDDKPDECPNCRPQDPPESNDIVYDVKCDRCPGAITTCDSLESVTETPCVRCGKHLKLTASRLPRTLSLKP